MGAAKAALRRRLCLIHQLSRGKNHHKKLLCHYKLKGLPASFIAYQFVLGQRDSVIRMMEMPVGERLLPPDCRNERYRCRRFWSLNYISQQMLKNFLTIGGVAPLLTPADSNQCSSSI
jgi:hypothetical protein